MKRREFITLVGAAAAWPLAARAQQAERMRRVGLLTGGLDKPNSGKGYPILLAELRKLGFIEGQNLVIEHRRTDEGTARRSIP